MNTLAKLGIDVAKKTFHVALRQHDKARHKQFANSATGFAELATWLIRHDQTQVHAILEATGIYSDALARFLHAAGHLVSVVNPARIKAFAKKPPHSHQE